MAEQSLNVLLVEDNPGDARLIQEMLAAFTDVYVETAGRLGEGIARASEPGIDVLLLDLSLPDSHGVETFTRAHADVPDVPIVVLTGTDDEALAVTAVTLGAQDYLVKDELDGRLLKRSIRYAVERHRMMRRLKRLTLLEERARIARDIHDGAIQSLFGVGMILKDTAFGIEDRTVARKILDGVEELSRLGRDLREFVHDLRPSILTGIEIEDALREVAEGYEANGLRVKIDVDAQAAGRVGTHGADLIHIVREALSNVVRHAHASSVEVSLKQGAGRVVLRIEDDGCGFSSTRPGHDGHGLRNINERAHVMGGVSTVGERDGGGTAVSVEIPASIHPHVG